MSGAPGMTRGDNVRVTGEEEPMQTDAVPYTSATYPESATRPDSRPVQEEGQHSQRSRRQPQGRTARPPGNRLVNEESLRHLPQGIRAGVRQSLRDAEHALDAAGIAPETIFKKKSGKDKQTFPMPGPATGSTRKPASDEKVSVDFFQKDAKVQVQSFVGCNNLQIGDKNIFHYTMNNYPAGSQRGKYGSEDVGSHDNLTKEEATDEQVERIKEVAREVSAEELNLLSEHVGATWRRLGRTLNFTDGQLDNLYHDFKGEGLQEACYQMLRKWKEKEGNQATVGRLATALLNIRQQDVIHTVFIKPAAARQ